MHGKGSGAVNRVELECQVLCAALRQSWVRQDKVGAFTSIRELSHLFPDLLPPPEEKNGSNKANYYETLTVRPQAGLNSIVIGYLKTVRKFLKEYNPKDYRQFYNTVLNAGFVLRKPRLRLSHDLVVARRWLYESQMEDDVEAEELPEQAEPVSLSGGLPNPDLAPAAKQAEAAGPETAQPESESRTPEPVSARLDAERSEEAVPQAPETDEEDDPLSLIEKSWDLTKAGQARETAAGNSVEPAQVVQETPTTGLQESEEQAAAEAAEPLAAHEAPQAVAAEQETEPPAHAQPTAGHTHKHPSFVFDEEQLHTPELAIELPSIIGLMEYAHLITKVEVQAMAAQIQLAPNIPVEQLILNAGYANRQEINSLRLAQDLLSSGKITMAQFQVAMYDERISGLRMAESLQVRGWLETEVKNIVEELKKPES